MEEELPTCKGPLIKPLSGLRLCKFQGCSSGDSVSGAGADSASCSVERGVRVSSFRV